MRGRYLLAFLLTASVFALGIFLGIIMSDYKITKIYDYERELMTNFLVQDIQSDLMEEDPCNFVSTGLASQELFRVGDRLDALEKDLGKDDEQVIGLKKYYNLIEIRDYLFYKKVNEECHKDFVLNLFFYSNDQKKCEKCEDQGFVLSYVRTKNDKIRTYSFDVDLGLPAIDYLTKFYKINDVPSVVFNEDVYYGFLDTEKVEEIVGK